MRWLLFRPIRNSNNSNRRRAQTPWLLPPERAPIWQTFQTPFMVHVPAKTRAICQVPEISLPWTKMSTLPNKPSNQILQRGLRAIRTSSPTTSRPHLRPRSLRRKRCHPPCRRQWASLSRPSQRDLPHLTVTDNTIKNSNINKSFRWIKFLSSKWTLQRRWWAHNKCPRIPQSPTK